MFGKFSLTLINYIYSSSPEKDSIELEEIKYGLDILISFFVKTVLIMLIGLILGLLPYLITAVITLALVKLFSGGVHAKNDFQCFVVTSLVIFSIIYLSLLINITIFYKVILFVLSFILLIAYAPADSEEKPIISENLRKKLKIRSCFISFIVFFVALLLGGVAGNVIILSQLAGSLFTTPVVYKIMGRRYRNFENFQVNQ